MFIEAKTAQQKDLLGRAISRMIGDLEAQQLNFDKGGAAYDHLQLEIHALSGMYSQLHKQQPTLREVGVAVEMPGTNGGFTMAAFNGKDVLPGTKVYA